MFFLCYAVVTSKKHTRKGKNTLNIGYQLGPDFRRPDPALIAQFSGIPVPNIGDCMNRTAAISSAIASVNGVRMQGCAYTVRVPAGDNLLFYYAIDNANPGDIIVVDGGGFTERALCGEIMAALAEKRGLAGFVIDGAIRDKAEIREMDFPVFCRAFTPNGPYKNGPGETNVPVNIGGRIIHPGDILIGDEGGLVSFSPNQAEELLEKAHAVMKKEAGIMKHIEETASMDLTWMYDKLKAEGVL